MTILVVELVPNCIYPLELSSLFHIIALPLRAFPISKWRTVPSLSLVNVNEAPSSGVDIWKVLAKPPGLVGAVVPIPKSFPSDAICPPLISNIPNEPVEVAEPLTVPSLETLMLSASITSGLEPPIVVASTLPNDPVEVIEPDIP